MMNKTMLEKLACPFCKERLQYSDTKLTCLNARCACVYRIESGVPVMLIDEAERPCPTCHQQREWTEDRLTCASCQTELIYEQK